MPLPALAPLLALAALAGRAGAFVWVFQFTGACDDKNFLNGLTFRMSGRTRIGAPFYKADGAEEYIYYDPDCSGAHDGQGRWILDNDRPSITAMDDLDLDGVCDYHARVDCPYSQRLKGPPMVSMWTMRCGSLGYQERFVTLIEITSTSTTSTSTTLTSTTTTATTTTATTTTATTTATSTSTTTVTSVTRSTTTATATVTTTATTTRTRTTLPETSTATATATTTETVTETHTTTDTETHTTTTTTASTTETAEVAEAAEAQHQRHHYGHLEPTLPALALELKVHGVCPAMEHLDGLLLRLVGHTASGAPYYAGSSAAGAVVYLYHDPSCDGFRTRPAPRWILDTDEPDLERSSDLDEDHKCDYLAAVDSKATARPPANAAWHAHCGSNWKIMVLSLINQVYTPPRNSSSTATTTVARGFLLSNARGQWPSACVRWLPLAAALGWLALP